MEVSKEAGQASAEYHESYQAEIEAIVSQVLRPEAIDSYAEQALEQLVEVIERATSAYSRQPTIDFATAKQRENATFGYYGLQDVERLLDNIADKADELRLIDTVIAQAPATQATFLPPTARDVSQLPQGEGRGEKVQLVPKLKTLLFIARNDFNVDLTDPQQVRLAKGNVQENMFRGQPYYSVEFPGLQRSVLVCDEMGNTTYVFDTQLLRDYELTSLDMAAVTKDEVAAFLQDDPRIGRQVNYSQNFIPRLIEALDDPAVRPGQLARRDPEEGAGTYLYPKAPADFLSASGLAKRLTVGARTVSAVIAALGEELGDVHTYRFYSKISPGYSPDQQQLIQQTIEATRDLLEAAPEGYYSAGRLAGILGVSDTAMYKAVAEIGDELGVVMSYKYGVRIVPGYTPQQQEQLRRQLEVQGAFSDSVPDGYTSAAGMRALWGISTQVINRVIATLGDSLGDVTMYRFGNKPAPGYSPQQQAMIRQSLEAIGRFTEKAPDGYYSVRGLSDAWKISFNAIAAAADELAEVLGPVQSYRFGGSNILAAGYSPDQQDTIRQYLEASGLFSEQPPEGYYSAGNLGKMWHGIAQATVYKAIDELGDQLGEVGVYKFKARVTFGYSPQQQALIKHYIEAKQRQR